jgi:integrase
MPVRKLTDVAAQRLKPPPQGRVEFFDAAFRGLSLRITAQGHKSWSLFFRIDGRQRRFTLGKYPALTPADARREAARILDKVEHGGDPQAERRTARYARRPEQETFKAAVKDYLELHARKHQRPSTFSETKRVLEGEDLKAWENRPLVSISRRDVHDVVDRISERAEIQANRTLAKLRAFFNWTLAKDRIKVSPTDRMALPNKEVERDRVLSDDEIRWLWTACDRSGWPFGPLTQLALLTAQRRDEVASIEWAEIDFGGALWTIPAAKAKNNHEHLVPLSTAALAILKSLPRQGDGLIFTTTGNTPVSGFSRAKRRLDREMEKARRKYLTLPLDDAEYRRALVISGNKPPLFVIQPWIIHDLRRTATTGMASLKVAPHVADKVLNHLSGEIRGVKAVYNKFQYLDDRRAALEIWGRHVGRLCLSTESNVIPFNQLARE